MNIEQILAQRWIDSQKEPSNYDRYKQKLFLAFPGNTPTEVLFVPNTFVEPDETDYLNCVNLFKNKKWFEVDLDGLYKNYSQCLYLTEQGELFYLPTFLSYFYELKHLDLEYFLYFMCILEGSINTYEEHSSKILDTKYDYTRFDSLTIEQAKLVATFLVNVANLFPENYYEAPKAQRALINYWGNFLLF
jgi:hypothetical protein